MKSIGEMIVNDNKKGAVIDALHKNNMKDKKKGGLLLICRTQI